MTTGFERGLLYGPGILGGAKFLLVLAIACPAQARTPAVTMNEVKDQFAACFHPPAEAAGSRVTFYFSFNKSGGVVSKPRTVWFGFKGAPEEKARRIADFQAGFEHCLPVALNPELAATIPGKVYFLQYVVASTGATSEILLRPFGSHGGGGEAPELVLPESVPYAPAPLYRGPTFRAPPYRNPYTLRPRDAIRPRTPNPALRPLRP